MRTPQDNPFVENQKIASVCGGALCSLFKCSLLPTNLLDQISFDAFRLGKHVIQKETCEDLALAKGIASFLLNDNLYKQANTASRARFILEVLPQAQGARIP